MAPRSKQLRARRRTPPSACRTGLDNHESACRELPEPIDKRRSLVGAKFVEHIGDGHQIGAFNKGCVAREVGGRHVAASGWLVASFPIVRIAGLASSSVALTSEGRASTAAHITVPGPAPTSSRVFAREIGRALAKSRQAGADRSIGRRHPRCDIGAGEAIIGDVQAPVTHSRRDSAATALLRTRQGRQSQRPRALVDCLSQTQWKFHERVLAGRRPRQQPATGLSCLSAQLALADGR